MDASIIHKIEESIYPIADVMKMLCSTTTARKSTIVAIWCFEALWLYALTVL